ncbi:hypothetical protein BP00DRAFT_412198 [Aspergillus indologenus CBS 114.80]|uniref:Uncharacterized protein n=1 Tax=Aspergillus indologenus CBS 114.80 TaxID=1450541 RepID=A0A2V5ILW3_9EURO|nr:hypothetical protein BP00DRAFT_412198 [Aspergillus indologenus CBS 114.80]
MSFAYPEGECFFKRSALRSSTYDPDKPEHFYGHLLVEYIWNRAAYSGDSAYYTKDVHYHPRSAYRVVKGDWWDTKYGNWTNIHFLYGKKPYSDEERYRTVEHNLCVSGNRFRDHDKGGALESWFMILPMPLLAKGEEWFLVDRTACIRGIYIPIAHQASEEYPDVCTFLQVNFAIPRQITVTVHPAVDSADRLSWVGAQSTGTINLDATLGLAPDAQWTMAINVRQLVNLLSLPRALRGHNCFSARIIRMVDRKLTPTKAGTTPFVSDGTDLSWATVASANYGLSIQWKPPQPTTWLADFIKNSLTVAVGFVPLVGPVAAVCFPLAWTALADPGGFDGTLKALIPVADLAMKVAEDMQRSVEEQVMYLPQEWSSTVQNFKLLAAAKRSAAEQEQAKASQPPAPAKVPAPELVKKFEAIRKFKYWNLMKPLPAAVTKTEETVRLDAAGEPVEAPPQPASAPENALPGVPAPLPLDKLKPSSSFQLAGQALQKSATPAATGHNDSSSGGILNEVRPEENQARGATNDERWLEAYLYEELFGESE